jgi:CRP-like cAMP-binding protein
MPLGPFRNTVLRHLTPDTIKRLQLKPITLPVRHKLEEPGKKIDHRYFIEEGIGSMTTSFEDGAQVETSMFGYESVVGVSGLMGVRKSLNNIFMQLAGHGFSSPIHAAHTEFHRNGDFQHLALRYVQVQLTLSTQNAACNTMHSYEQRLARWLLICSDRARRERIDMAQDFVAQMLGSMRSTVSIAAANFKVMGLIDYARGAIRILDARGLEAEACECYRVVRDHLEGLADFDTGFVV